MENEKPGDSKIIEKQNYVLVLVIGFALICISAILYLLNADSFLQSLLLNLGSDMVVITIVFMVFKVFQKYDQQPDNSPKPKQSPQIEFINRDELLSNEITKLVQQLYRNGQYDNVITSVCPEIPGFEKKLRWNNW